MANLSRCNMPRMPSLPERLSYLQPFRKKFSAKPDELDESSGCAPLLALLHKRIKGCPDSEAEALLKEDGAALEVWLALPENESDPLHFASAFLCMMEPAELMAVLADELRKPSAPQIVAEMDLPAGAKLRKDGLITFRQMLVGLSALSEELMAKYLLVERKGHGGNGVSAEEISVSFGQVAGTKFVRRGETWRGPYKDIVYYLSVPGGRIHASVSPYGKKTDEWNWNEFALEAELHTLRVVQKQPN